jgi:hypothetical protein
LEYFKKSHEMTMGEGKCRLCFNIGALQDSHLLPKAFYGLLREPDDKNPNPIVVTPDIYMKTSKQVSEYLLCKDCEDRFNKRGEKWVLEHCWRGENDFPAHSALHAAIPFEQSDTGFRAYDGNAVPGIDLWKLIYFSASVFWRAAAHQWKPVLGHAPVRLEFGPFEEPLRKFLLDEGELPLHAVFVITVNATTEAGPNKMMLFPWRDHHDSYFHHKFVVPGLRFQLFLGKGIPAHVRDLCAARSEQHPIFVSTQAEMHTLKSAATMTSTAKPKGKLD